MDDLSTSALKSDEFDNVNMPGTSWHQVGGICFSSDHEGSDKIWTMDSSGNIFTAMTTPTGNQRDWEPTWSPDGSRIVFQRYTGEIEEPTDIDVGWKIFKLHVAGGLTQLTENVSHSDRQPNWSPSGNMITFQRYSISKGDWDVWTMDDNGAFLTNVTNDPSSEDTDPSWSPDGTFIIYSSDNSSLSNADIFVMRADGKDGKMRITTNTAYDGAPAWSPDGKKIAFESNRTGNLDIFVTNIISPPFTMVNDWLYQLQDMDLNAIKDTAYDLVVMDYSSDGTGTNEYNSADLAFLKSNANEPKLVLAYMSIGEAEEYRYYWQSSWASNPPAWLGPENPDWPGNYKVKYWNPEWKSLIYGSTTAYLDKIIAAGFDGVYLDIIDAYDFWQNNGYDGSATAKQDMVDFVVAIADYARTTKNKPFFGIFVQNAEELWTDSTYLKAVTGIGREDTWYNDNLPVASAETIDTITDLQQWQAAGKLVFTVDYPTEAEKILDFYSKSLENRFVPYTTTRQLNQLIINLGHNPD